jgi:hypothetical protein
MRTLKIAFLAIFVALATQACGKEAVPSPEKSCHFQQNSYEQRVSWQQTPVTMFADLSLTEEQVTALEDALEIWNQALLKHRKGKKVFKFGGILQKHIGLKNDYMNVVSLTDNWDGDIAEQAQTMLLWEGTTILEADIIVNGEKPFSVLDTGEPGKIDMVALFVHELGRVLGLLHIEPTEKDPYTVMNPYLARGDVERRTIGSVELNALACEY